MFPPFNEAIAKKYCLDLASKIDNGSIKLNQITAKSIERAGQGLMLGSLYCKTLEGTFVVLQCVSGISRQFSLEQFYDDEGLLHIIVPPIVEPKKIEEALEQNDKQIHILTEKINALKNFEMVQTNECENARFEFQKLITERTILTDESLQKVFDLYDFYTVDGSLISLNDIIKKQKRLPPTGTGDCCAPKLLNYAFKNDYTPISMSELYYGKDTKSKMDGHFYGPCDERCGFILPFILGLEILYVDENIVVVNKQSGLLSVPGRGPDKADSVVSRVKKLYPFCIEQPSVHRLDMETSGLLVLAFDAQSHKNLNKQFADGVVQKSYVALLDGILEKSSGELSPKKGGKTGEMQLKFRLDVDNRPHQIYDEENGKLGITLWENLGVVNYTNPASGECKKVTRIKFVPKTGRTHQLRLAASSIHGFNLPIIGDTLYGKCEQGQRLMLHAQELSFYHPVTGEKMHFYCPAEF